MLPPLLRMPHSARNSAHRGRFAVRIATLVRLWFPAFAPIAAVGYHRPLVMPRCRQLRRPIPTIRAADADYPGGWCRQLRRSPPI